MSKPQPILFLDDHRGTAIPRDFATTVYRSTVSGVSDEEWAALEDTECEWHWEAWDSVLGKAVITDSKGVKWSLYQDGALWLIPEGMEWSDKEGFYVYPEEG